MRYIPAEPLLSPSLIIKSLRSRRRTTREGLRLFSYGRHALAQYAVESGITEGILYAPSYICVDAVRPLERLGQTICYYPVKEDLTPDWEWLFQNAGPQSRALLLVHYFGFPNAVDETLAFCRERQMLLIEDCAHSFLTRLGGQTIGAFGDAGFYSFRKTLPLLDGGGLVTNDIDTVSLPSEGDDTAAMPYRTLLGQLVRFGVCKTHVPSPLWRWWQKKSGPSPTDDRADVESPPHPRPITKFSQQIMEALEPDFEKIISRRRENYLRLSGAFSPVPNIQLLYPELLEGVCPYLFPMLVQDRDNLARSLRSRGIPAYGWPELPEAVSASTSSVVAVRYARDVLTLPVHQDLNPRQIDYIIETTTETIRQTGKLSELVTSG